MTDRELVEWLAHILRSLLLQSLENTAPMFERDAIVREAREALELAG